MYITCVLAEILPDLPQLRWKPMPKSDPAKAADHFDQALFVGSFSDSASCFGFMNTLLKTFSYEPPPGFCLGC